MSTDDRSPVMTTPPSLRISWRRLRWTLLVVVFVALAFTFSVIQPLGRTPDEGAHVQYIVFLAEQGRLPVFSPRGGGEAGYEAQHPPLYYALMAVAWACSAGLATEWRWHLLRWLTVVIVGGGTFLVCARMFRRIWPDHDGLAWAATATTMLMPLTLLYVAYINPDGMAMLWASATLWLSLEIALGQRRWPLCLALGAVVAAAALTKISALPTLLVAAVACYLGWRRSPDRAWLQHAGATLGTFLLLGGWWYARNLYLYGSLTLKTAAPYGSGLDNALRTGNFLFYAWLSIRETFLSTWIQRGWLPAGAVEYALYGVVILYTLGAVAGWIIGRRERSQGDFRAEGETSGGTARWGAEHVAALLMLILLASVVAGQQLAFWLADVEFNAGGRYVLMAMSGIALLGLVGWRKLLAPESSRGGGASPATRTAPALSTVALALWLVAIVVMDLASAWNIVTVLNPRYAPGWQLLHFPPG